MQRKFYKRLIFLVGCLISGFIGGIFLGKYIGGGLFLKSSLKEEQSCISNSCKTSIFYNQNVNTQVNSEKSSAVKQARLEYLRKKIAKVKTWYWHLQGKVNLENPADVYDIDPSNVTSREIEKLHKEGKLVICYISVGSAEKFRPDFNKYPNSIKGKPLSDWPDEVWLDISHYNDFAKILEKRFFDAYQKGCDGIEGDNVDVYDNDSGFTITKEHTILFVKFLANLAHKYGMLYGLKNSAEIVDAVVDDVDFAVVEECLRYNECEAFQKFIKQDKPVFAVEYVSFDNKTNICNKFKNLRFVGALACYDLNGCWLSCK